MQRAGMRELCEVQVIGKHVTHRERRLKGTAFVVRGSFREDMVEFMSQDAAHGTS